MRNLPGLGRLLTSAALLATALLSPALALADTTAIADCAPPPPLEKAVFSDLVFVGRVTDIANGGRSAVVEVSEVWRGDVPTPLTVNGGADPTNPGEDDRMFELGTTYLFVPVQFDDLRQAVVVDSVCSSTTPWSDDLARLRPANVGQPLPANAASSGPNPFAFLGDLAMPIATAGIVGGGAFVLALLVARRREA
ncbi:MAG: hypothetical protein V4515_08520 [Chloroflexota bacterium]